MKERKLEFHFSSGESIFSMKIYKMSRIQCQLYYVLCVSCRVTEMRRYVGRQWDSVGEWDSVRANDRVHNEFSETRNSHLRSDECFSVMRKTYEEGEMRTLHATRHHMHSFVLENKIKSSNCPESDTFASLILTCNWIIFDFKSDY